MAKEKIYYDLNLSKFQFETDNMIFYFSSMFYLSKFTEKCFENRVDLKHKLTSRFNIEFDGSDYFDIILYSSIEKRGFRIEHKETGVVFKCLNNIKLSGEIKTLTS